MIAFIKQLSGNPTRTMAMNLFVASSIMGPLHPAAAQDIYATSFQPPAFVAGAPLNGQDGWSSPVPFLSPNAAIIAATKKGGQSVRVDGASLESQPFINEVTDGYYEAIGAYRRGLDHDSGNTQTVRLSVDVRLDGRATPKSNFFSASLIAVASNVFGDSEGVGELAISSDGHVYGSSGQDLVPVFLTSTRIARGTWHNLAIEVDFAERTYSFYVDDEYLGTFNFAPFEPSGVLRRATLITYAAPDTARDKKADHAANFDNFSVEVVSDDGE